MAVSELLLRKVDISNFKSIAQADLALRQLTVLVGENSAGKSSLIQTIFLLAQISRETSRPGLVSLNGTELSLGNFGDVVHGGHADQPIKIGLTVSSRTELRRRFRSSRLSAAGPHSVLEEAASGEASWRVTLTQPADNALGVAGVSEIVIDDASAGVQLHITPNSDAEQADATRDYVHSRRLGLVRPTPSPRGRMVSEVERATRYRGRIATSPSSRLEPEEQDEILPAVTVENAFPVELYSSASESLHLARRWLELISVEAGPEYRRRWLQSRVRERTGGRDTETAVKQIESATDTLFPVFRRWVVELDRMDAVRVPRADLEGDPRELLEPLARYAEAIAREFASRLETDREERGALTPHPSATLEVAAGLTALFRDAVHYLGPLREDPSPSYRPGQTGGVATLGVKGQYTVAALNAYRDQLTLCPIDGDARELRLEDAVNHWAAKFGIASAIETVDKGRSGLELSLVDPQTRARRDPTSVGVGASQLLPVMVLCLLAQPGELVLLEQPELHLHPAPQQILGDFLVGIAETGRQLLIETHSEYLINRLRLLIAEDQYDNVANLVQIWYARRADGKTVFSSLQPNRFGSLAEWPAGFFDQAPRDAEALLRAAASKRSRGAS